MSAGANVPALADDDEHGATWGAPMPPFENYVVGAVRALEATKSQTDQALLLLQWAPRDPAAVFDALANLERCAANARNSYAAYAELLSCKGQA